VDFQFNIALGRTAELYKRVKVGDPAGSSLVVVALAASGIETDAVLKDKDSLADVLAGATNEATNTGYVRKTLTAAELNTVAPNDALDRMDLDIPDLTWSTVQAEGGAWAKLIICYQPSGSATDAQIEPLTSHDFGITPDGTNIVAQVDPAGFFGAV
jgi:hypothetical protein